MNRELPEPRDLGHGISVVPLPLPFRSPPWVNAYLVHGEDGTTLIDCGADWQPGHRALIDGIGAVGADPSQITRLVVSHLHPDHVGMAPRVRRDWGVDVVMHKHAEAGYRRYNDTNDLARRIRNLADRHGVPAEERAAFVDLGPRPDFMPLLDPPDRLVDDGDHIHVDVDRTLEVLHTPGHEQSHICLRDSRTGILFSGDHVLPRITPVIMADDGGDDVLAAYLESLQRVIDLDVGLTYPAHGVIVERGASRARQIVLHHERRLGGMYDIVAGGPTTAWVVMGESYRPHLTTVEQRLALRETVSHLEHLRLTERLVGVEEAPLLFYRTP